MNAHKGNKAKKRTQESPCMTPRLERIIAAAEKDLKAGRNISPVFTNADDAIRWLRSK